MWCFFFNYRSNKNVQTTLNLSLTTEPPITQHNYHSARRFYMENI